MNTEKINECYTILSDIHNFEDDIVIWYSQRGEQQLESIHGALSKRRMYLSNLCDSKHVNYPAWELFITP